MFTPTGHRIPRNQTVNVQTRPQPDYGVNGQLYAPGARIGGDGRQYRSLAPANEGGERQYRSIAPADGGSEQQHSSIAPANGGGEPQFRSLAPPPPPGGRR